MNNLALQEASAMPHPAILETFPPDKASLFPFVLLRRLLKLQLPLTLFLFELVDL